MERPRNLKVYCRSGFHRLELFLLSICQFEPVGQLLEFGDHGLWVSDQHYLRDEAVARNSGFCFPSIHSQAAGKMIQQTKDKICFFKWQLITNPSDLIHLTEIIIMLLMVIKKRKHCIMVPQTYQSLLCVGILSFILPSRAWKSMGMI